MITVRWQGSVNEMSEKISDKTEYGDITERIISVMFSGKLFKISAFLTF